MSKSTPFRLEVASPCRASWDNMDGDDRVRFCRQCSRNVYDLSTMNRRDAERFVTEREGRVCVRFFERRDGTVMTADCPVGSRRGMLAKSARSLLAMAAIAAGTTTWSACGGAVDPEGNPTMGAPEPEDRVIMGEAVAIPVPEDGRVLLGKIRAPHDTE